MNLFSLIDTFVALRSYCWAEWKSKKVSVEECNFLLQASADIVEGASKDKPARLIIRLLFGFVSDLSRSIKMKTNTGTAVLSKSTVQCAHVIILQAASFCCVARVALSCIELH